MVVNPFVHEMLTALVYVATFKLMSKVQTRLQCSALKHALVTFNLRLKIPVASYHERISWLKQTVRRKAFV